MESTARTAATNVPTNSNAPTIQYRAFMGGI